MPIVLLISCSCVQFKDAVKAQCKSPAYLASQKAGTTRGCAGANDLYTKIKPPQTIFKGLIIDHLIAGEHNMVIPDTASSVSKVTDVMKKLYDKGYSIVVALVYSSKDQCRKNGSGLEFKGPQAGQYDMNAARDVGEGKVYEDSGYGNALLNGMGVFDWARKEFAGLGNKFMVIDNSDFTATPENKIAGGATSGGALWDTATHKIKMQCKSGYSGCTLSAVSAKFSVETRDSSIEKTTSTKAGTAFGYAEAAQCKP